MKRFASFVYRAPGHIIRGGRCYEIMPVQTQGELDMRLASGWHATLQQAFDAAGDAALVKSINKRAKWRKPKGWKKEKKPSKPIDGVNRRALMHRVEAAIEHVEPEPELARIEDDAEPTREELEAKAAELGIKFDGRTSKKKLNRLIDEALAG
jgi:hypothetical protein